IDEHSSAVCGIIERLRGTRTIRILIGVLLVDVGFLCRTLLGTLPVAAELVVNEVEGGQSGPTRARIIFDDLLELVLIHQVAHVCVFLVRRWTRGSIGFFDLPFDVRGAPGGLRRERRAGEHLGYAAIEQARTLRSVGGTTRIGSLRLLVGGGTHNDLVAV